MNHSAPTTWLSPCEYPFFEELALMVRGQSRSETTRKEAAEMLKAARKRD